MDTKISTSSRNTTITIAWVFILLASLLPMVILQEIFQQDVSENLQYTMAAIVVLAGLALTFIWKAAYPLRPFFILFLVFTGAEWIVFTKVDKLPFYRTLLRDPSFNIYMPAEKFLGLIVTLTIIAVLFILKKKRAAFFLVKGDTAAPVEPVRWLDIKQGEHWDKLGRKFAIIISLATLTFLVIAGRPPLDILLRALPFLPAVLICAALNAFNEEVSYKASFLSVLEEPVGKQHALWLMAAYFGLAHFYGVPYGVIGVLMATFLGWFLGKSMLETRGLWWAWFIHFMQDILIFAFMAIGSVQSGGG